MDNLSDPVSARRERFALPIIPLLPADPNPALPAVGPRAIYPYTRAYHFAQEPVERELDALILENALLNLQVVPALGGRLWGSTNRLTGQPLFYTPRRVGMINFGLRGAWYSGGVEFNFPRGHTVIRSGGRCGHHAALLGGTFPGGGLPGRTLRLGGEYGHQAQAQDDDHCQRESFIELHNWHPYVPGESLALFLG